MINLVCFNINSSNNNDSSEIDSSIEMHTVILDSGEKLIVPNNNPNIKMWYFLFQWPISLNSWIWSHPNLY